jgi:uncharacterized membrane protein (GlpM family)
MLSLLKELIARLRVAKDRGFYEFARSLTYGISAILPVFFVVSNYFFFLEPDSKNTAEGILFLVVSIVYALTCAYFCFKKI